jgi:large subunit ribosomal protein L2
MGKNLIQQRRGKGTPTFRAPSFRYIGKVQHPKLTDATVQGTITDLISCQGHSAPLAQIKLETGEKTLAVAPEGVKVGDNLKLGPDAEIKPGNMLPLKNIPEGVSVYNIENIPGDGGRFVRSSGVFAKVVGKIGSKVVIKFPSNKQKLFREDCRANIGVVAGGGRPEKPFLKAGKKYHAMKAKNKFYPKVCGVSMNAVDHPFGGKSSHHKGKPTQSSRNAPPGRKVGKIAPRRTGRTKR